MLEVVYPFANSLCVCRVLGPRLETMVSKHVLNRNSFETLHHVIATAT